MDLKHRHDHRVWKNASTKALVQSALDDWTEECQARELGDILARLIDALPLTDKQKLDIITPYSGWEIVK